MSLNRFCFVLSSAAVLLFAPTVHAQVSKGHLILMDRGLQIQGMITPDNYFHLDVYSNANYTAVNFLGDSSGNLGPISTFVGATPGFPWARWANDETNMPCAGTNNNGISRTNEIPYTNQLVNVQLGDEWDLNGNANRTRLVNWFLSVKTNWPNTILYHNNWGSQIGDGPLADFYTRAHPDMLCFDTYPWKALYDLNQPDHVGAAIAGPPTGWYGDLRRYREHAKGAGIPLGIYRQTFHAVEEYYPYNVYRDPSKSELRLNTFAALAFNVKCLSDFVYNTGAASLFTKTFNGSGDTVISTNGLYAEMTDANQRARNLGKALLRLTPAYDLHNTNAAYWPNGFPPGPGSDNPNFSTNGYTTSIMFLRGKYLSGGVTNFTDVPNSFLADPDVASSNPAGTGQAYTWWEADKNDPYLRGWVVTNKAAIKNNGLLGDAILAWFKPLDESMDGTNYTNEIYMMVVNGLTATNGTAADCLQEIRLNFLNSGAAASGVVMLDPATGNLQTNVLPIVNTRRQLVLNLNGGDAALFKFNTGAPFVGITPIAPRLGVTRQGSGRTVSVQGAIGSRYQLEAATSLPATNWTVLTNLVLASGAYTFTDTATPGSARYYRAVAIP
jgi:hypothetical protein